MSEPDASPPSRVDTLERVLREIESDIDAAREHNRWSAVASLYNSWRQQESELTKERDRVAGGDPEADMSDDELLEVVLDAIRAFAGTAPTFFDRIVEEVESLNR